MLLSMQKRTNQSWCQAKVQASTGQCWTCVCWLQIAREKHQRIRITLLPNKTQHTTPHTLKARISHGGRSRWLVSPSCHIDIVLRIVLLLRGHRRLQRAANLL